MASNLTPAAKENESSPLALTRQLRVLVVDDDQDSVLTLSILLQDEGHDVRVAYSGGSALVVAHHFKPDVVYIDISLPDISGWEVARQLHSGDAAPPVLIAVSGVYTKAADRILAKTVGFSHFVAKPYDPPALLALLDPIIWGEDS